jgi:hypothetical protein
MAELKTKPTDQNVLEFLIGIEPETKRKDALMLLEIFQKVTGTKPIMWGSSIVGFGSYHYKSQRSKQEGDWPIVGFSPRVQNLTLYIMAGNTNNPLLSKLGKHKTSVGCLYINNLEDVNLDILSSLIATSFEYTKSLYK